MIERFRLLSDINESVREEIVPLRLADFDHATHAMNETYLDMLTMDRMGQELLLESTISASEISRAIINEGVIGALIDSARKLFKTIIDFIKGLIAKINLFADSMRKNINTWMKKVAPTALARSKEIKYVKNLEHEGYNWDEAYIGAELMGKLKNIMAIRVKKKSYKISGDDVTVIEESTDSSITTATKIVIDSNKHLEMLKNITARKSKMKQAEAEGVGEKKTAAAKGSSDANNKNPEAKEFKADIPDVAAEDSAKTDKGGNDAKGVSNKDIFKEAIDTYLKNEFGATKTDYTEKIIKAAKRGTEPVTKKGFSASIIQRYVNFIASSPSIVSAIHNRYSALLEEYNKLYDAINSMDSSSISEGDSDVLAKYNKYVKQPVYETLGFIRDCTAINNAISKTNIALVEECTKEYMKICNKLALMKGGSE